MNTRLVDGNALARKLLLSLEKRVAAAARRKHYLTLAVLLVGNDPASMSFIRKKEQSCRRIGIGFRLIRLPAKTSEKKVYATVKKLCRDRSLSGIVIQLPLPRHISPEHILGALDPRLDVDCLTAEHLGRLTIGDARLMPPTAAAILHILNREHVSLSRKHIVMVGFGDLVGKPLGILLTQDRTTVTICNKYTRNLAHLTRHADILISAVGKPGLIRGAMVKPGAIVIDAGTTLKKGRLLGDVDFASVAPRARLMTPVPGGVGPLTVACLLQNVCMLALEKNRS